jgi:tetratricopeptide (TPR) repeat protein
MDKIKSPNPKGPTPSASLTGKSAPAGGAPGPMPPLFRRIDWLTFAVTTLVVMIGYAWTLAPDLTLEDSGELAVASYYAGIPHPPGYPVWTIYTYFWSLIPFSNIAWRVALGSAFAGALACGLLGLIVSRGSSMLMEGIEELRTMTGKWEGAICVVSGFVAGGLLAFNGFMWSQSVIVEVYSFSVLSLVLVLLCLLRWMYAPEQKRYLYWLFFLFGICFTNHQSLLVAAMGIEVAILAARPALGRDFLLANSLCYLGGLVLKAAGQLTTFNSPPGQMNMMFVIFNLVGLASLAGLGWMVARTQKLLTEWRPVLISGLLFLVGAGFYLYMPVAGMTNPPMQWGYPRTVEGFVHALTRGQYEKANPTNFLNDPGRFVAQLGGLVEQAAEEFSWVFLLIALVPFLFLRRMQHRERAWLIGVTAIYLCLGVLLMILLNPPPDRAARELLRVFFTASHVCVALLVGYGLTLITAYMATQYTRFRLWGLLGGAVAFALAFFSLTLTTESMFGGEGKGNSLGVLWEGIGNAFSPHQYGLPIFAGLLLLGMTVVFVVGVAVYRQRAPLMITLAMFAVMPGYSLMKNWFENEQHGHLFGYWFGHDMFTPPFKVPDGTLSYDPELRAKLRQDPEQVKLIYPEMARNAVLYGGTDPGRFCPTYTIFCESFTPPRCKPKDPLYDRRDVYIITQNALADGTYLMYIRAHYNKSDQVKYDTPFFQQLLRPASEIRSDYKTNGLARLAGALLDRPLTALGDAIEKNRRAGSSYFTAADLADAFPAKLRAAADPLSQFLVANLRLGTQRLLDEPKKIQAAKRALATDLNGLLERELIRARQIAKKRAALAALEEKFFGSTPSKRQERQVESLRAAIEELAQPGPLYTPDRFAQVSLSDYLLAFIRQNPQSHTRIRLNRLLLEAAYPDLIARSPGGVYPDREILIATPEDSQRCFHDYLEDAQRRLRLNQLKPGENVQLVGQGDDQRVQVSGQVAVMTINGLLTKVMFDKNPENEFYVEESFPLDWMYPHLTPFGIIMKINREPLAELSEEILQRDHHFWAEYSERLIGNWITYDTPVKEIAEFAERLYLRRNFTGFQGDRKFARDDQAQKAFSKLRSSIAGIYAWRVAEATTKLFHLQTRPPEEQAALRGEIARWSAIRDRLIKETDFAFRQAFAFCPYSPEAVFRYCQLLLSLNRVEDARLVAETCRKLDPYNAQVVDLVKRLEEARTSGHAVAPATPDILAAMEQEVAQHPTNFQTVLNLAANYMGLGQTGRSYELLDGLLHHPQADASAVLAVAQAYSSVQDFPKLETVLERLVQLSPTQPEAWYDLAAIKAFLGKTADCLPPLRQALALSDDRLKTDAKQRDLRAEALKDARFLGVHANAEFQALIKQKP